ncbi:MAG: DUF4350 domain-containing protein [Verrucomicrobiota bacterium]
MRRRNLLLPALAFVALALFLVLLVRLLLLRYERGDVYPAYSTLRADPLGTRAFYEALGAVGGYRVARGTTTLHEELRDRPDAVFYLGLDKDEIPFFTPDEVALLDDYVKNGGRVVITFDPETSTAEEKKKDEQKDKDEIRPSDKPAKDAPPSKDAKDAKDAKETPAPEPEPEPAGPQTQEEKYERDELKRENEEDKRLGLRGAHPAHYHRTLAALWGFGWDNHHEAAAPLWNEKTKDADEDDDDEKPEVLALSTPAAIVEATVPWKSALYFTRIEPEWQVLYNAKDKPVFIRRAWGRGEILIAGDSYFVSDEALREDRRPALLSLLAGPGGSLLFDETHLGTQDQEGVMSLAEKYRLEGYLYGMLGVVLLVLWRNSSPLVPPRAAGARLGGAVSGKDSRSGLVNLLRRNIGVRDILKASFAEWRKQVTPTRVHLRARQAEMEGVLAAADTGSPAKILASYHQLQSLNTPTPGIARTHATKS